MQYLVLTLDQQVQQLLCVNYSLSKVGHEPNEGCVPLVDDLGEGGGARGHQDLTHTVMEPRQALFVHSQETLCSPLLGHLTGRCRGREIWGGVMGGERCRVE